MSLEDKLTPLELAKSVMTPSQLAREKNFWSGYKHKLPNPDLTLMAKKYNLDIENAYQIVQSFKSEKKKKPRFTSPNRQYAVSQLNALKNKKDNVALMALYFESCGYSLFDDVVPNIIGDTLELSKSFYSDSAIRSKIKQYKKNNSIVTDTALKEHLAQSFPKVFKAYTQDE